MNLIVNQLFKHSNGNVIRVLYINSLSNVLYVINMEGNRWCYPMQSKDLIEAIQSKEWIEVHDTYIRAVSEEQLSEKEREKRDKAWEIVTAFLQELDNDEFAFIGSYRKQAIDRVLRKYKISYNGFKALLLKYWRGGSTKNSLLPNYYKCGSSGKNRNLSNKKVGRPSKRGRDRGLNVDEKVKRQFKAALNKYYYNERNNSLKFVYEMVLKDYYTVDSVNENGVSIPILAKAVPTYNQFLYWFKKLNDTKKEIIQRQGMRNYQQNNRAIIGTSTSEGWQFDSTQFDIYLVSSTNRNVIVGRPTLHMAVCAFTRMIMGFSISFESLNGYGGEMLALYNAMTSKKQFCKRYGIEIDDSEWAFGVPSKILTDQGALEGKRIEHAIERLGIAIQQTPPYHADYKGIIEQAFEQLNVKIKPFADGVVIKGNQAKERGQKDYRLQATMTIDEFTKVLIKTVLFHNNHHVLKDYVLTEEMIELGVEKIPIKLWDYYVNHYKGSVRILPEELIRINLLPTDTGTLTARGVSFKKMLYASPELLAAGNFVEARVNGSKKVKICYNPLDISEIYMYGEDGQLHKLTLLEHLVAYKGKGLDEVLALKEYEQNKDRKSQEKELQAKMKLYEELEAIVNVAREESAAERDPNLSKAQRIRGIKDNQQAERMLQREILRESKVKEPEELVDEFDEFAIFRGEMNE
ncbi:Mu transposase C-terminal domain-containing protein [Lysinibacillus sp. FSL K6-0232]|uniref:Mu transposase C-terminal domain-containing protein n=1 Tax=Lysinibacillus sp. FSL K6-0232 TaxID=2921425 RepID=UPI0030F87FA9